MGAGDVITPSLRFLEIISRFIFTNTCHKIIFPIFFSILVHGQKNTLYAYTQRVRLPLLSYF